MSKLNYPEIKYNLEVSDDADIVSAIVHYHNYQYFTSELGRFHFFYFGQYNHKYLFDRYIKHEKDSKAIS